MATLAELRDEVKRRLVGDLAAKVGTRLIDESINSAIAAAYPYWFSVSTAVYTITAGGQSYPVPDDARDIIRVRVVDQSGTSQTITRWSYREGTREVVLHVSYPGMTLEVDYTTAPAALVGDTDATYVPTAFIAPRAASAIMNVEATNAASPDDRAALARHASILWAESEAAIKRYRYRWPAAGRRVSR